MFEIISKLLLQITETVKTLPDNEIFIGLLFTGLATAGLFFLRKLPELIFRLFENNFCLILTFEQRDADRVLMYLKTLPILFGPKSYDIGMGDDTTKLKLGEGLHIKRYKKTFLFARVLTQWSEYSGEKYTTLKIYILSRKEDVVTQIIDDVYNYNFKGTIKILVSCGYDWELQKTSYHRPIDSLFYPNNLGQTIINDVNEWKQSRENYKRFGIPYRRGYLFYGEPGTGKTSIITTIANELNKVVYYFDPSTVNSNYRLMESIREVKPGSILVVEDVDATFTKRKPKKNKGDNSEFPPVDEYESNKFISISGFLNVFDGLISAEEFIVIFTTNHRDKLDPALVRSGRIDREFEFKKLDFPTLKRMSKHYGVELRDDVLESWCPITPADAQNKLLLYLKGQ